MLRHLTGLFFFKGLYISLASVFVFLLLCVDILQRAKPSCLMLQIRNTLRRLWQISARLGCQIKKNEEVEAQSIGIHPTVSKCRLSVLASLQYEINQIQQRPILLFFLFIQANSIGMNLKQHVLADSTGGSLSPTCTHTLLSSLPGRCHKYWKYFLSH